MYQEVRSWQLAERQSSAESTLEAQTLGAALTHCSELCVCVCQMGVLARKRESKKEHERVPHASVVY